MGAFSRYVVKIGMLILLFPLRLFRVKPNKVVMVNNILLKHGDFSSNPKYLTLYIKKYHPEIFDVVLMVGRGSEPKEVKDLNVTMVKENSIKYFYHVMTCGFFFDKWGYIIHTF